MQNQANSRDPEQVENRTERAKFRRSAVAGILIASTLALSIALNHLLIHAHPLSDPEGITRARLHALAELLQEFRKVCTTYPTTDEGLKSLDIKPSSVSCAKYPKNGIAGNHDAFSVLTLDGWGNSIRYTSSANKYRLDASHGISIEAP